MVQARTNQISKVEIVFEFDVVVMTFNTADEIVVNLHPIIYSLGKGRPTINTDEISIPSRPKAIVRLLHSTVKATEDFLTVDQANVAACVEWPALQTLRRILFGSGMLIRITRVKTRLVLELFTATAPQLVKFASTCPFEKYVGAVKRGVESYIEAGTVSQAAIFWGKDLRLPTCDDMVRNVVERSVDVSDGAVLVNVEVMEYHQHNLYRKSGDR